MRPRSKIIVEHVFPPIPLRQFDWSATYDDYDYGDIIGYGKTEDEAIEDLIQQEESND